VVHGIVAGLGGSIHVESAVGRGTCFEVLLPIANQPAVTDATRVTERGEHERLLLVDDQPLVRAGLSRLLSSLGYRVSEAADGQEALERLRATPGEFDLLISDQTMPRLSGLELARALRAEGSRMPIILCSGFSEVLDEQNALKVGVSGVLAKPIDRTSMAAAVKRALG
jgi:CheY-like chemotaxis protein